MSNISRLLVIPDAHAHPDMDNRRFDALNRFIRDYAPSHIVCLGDFADCPSLSSFDKGKKGFEGRRYRKDVEVARDAMARMLAGVRCKNRIMVLGNHEDRINRAVSNQPELEGTISIQDLGYEKAGWQVVPYRKRAVVGGFVITHCFLSQMGKALGGEHPARTLLNKKRCSLIVGHSHLRDHQTQVRADGKRMESIVAGHFAHPDLAHESWAEGTADNWWAGICLLEDVSDGAAGKISFVSASSL